MRKLKMKNDILLIDPREKGSWHMGINLGLAYIASVLESNNFQVKIIDRQVQSEEEMIKELNKVFYVGIYINVGTVKRGLQISKFIREKYPEVKIIMGGSHASIIYNKLIPKYADIIVIGEGEYTTLEILQEKKLQYIKGIAYWDNEIKLNESREPIKDLDKLPFPALHLFDLNAYKRKGIKSPAGAIMTSRGCPYQCIYCGVNIILGDKLRTRSIENVMQEIDYLINKVKVKEIFIYDSLFNLYPKRVERICKEIIKRNYNTVVYRAFGMRGDKGDYHMYKLMKEAGFTHVRIGVESGNQEIINKIEKGLDLQKIKPTIANIRRAGLGCGAFFMLGLPYDTKETMQETIDFAKQLDLDEAIFSIATPMAGTKFYDLISEKGKFLQDLNFECSDMKKAVHEFDELKPEEINQMWKSAYKQFYMRPKQIYKTLIKHKFTFVEMVFKTLYFGEKT